MSSQTELDNPASDVISSLSFSQNGEQIFVGSWDSSIRVYQISSSAGVQEPFVLQKVIETDAPVLDVCSSPSGDIVYWVGLDQYVHRGTTETGERDILSTHGGVSNKLAYSKEYELLLSMSWDGTMHVHDCSSNSTGAFIKIRLASKPFALSLTQDRAVVAMAERKVSVYSLEDLKQLVEQQRDASGDMEVPGVNPWQDRESSLKFMTRAVACMPDGTGFATSSIEGRVGVEWFDPEAQKKTYAFKCHRQSSTTQDENGEERQVDIVYPVNALAFHPVHGTFATGGGDGVVALWDAQTKRRVRQYQKLGASVATMQFSPDGKFLAIGVSPGFEDGKEDEETDSSLVKVVVRTLGENEAKGKAAKEKS